MSFFRTSFTSPSSATTSFLITVAILSSLMTESPLRPVAVKPVCVLVRRISEIERLVGIFDDMNARITSYSFSLMTSAGLNLDEVRSVNGKGTRTILPFIDRQPGHPKLNRDRVLHRKMISMTPQKVSSL